MSGLCSLNNVRPIILMTDEIPNDLQYSHNESRTFFSVEIAKNLSQNVLWKREFSHHGTEEMHVEKQALIRNVMHVTYLIMCPWDMQCVCKATKALKVRFEEHKSDVSRRMKESWLRGILMRWNILSHLQSLWLLTVFANPQGKRQQCLLK